MNERLLMHQEEGARGGASQLLLAFLQLAFLMLLLLLQTLILLYGSALMPSPLQSLFQTGIISPSPEFYLIL